ncbi:MAG: hypothetical protein EOP10_25680 [Proteobacteria bacterium]|nr:MAG: hypothetical protein EOP10_25680 [Pseudomonadota bacterium]
MNLSFRAGNYTAALEKFDKVDLKEESRNRMLYYLEKGMIQDRLGKRESSRNLWMKADKVGDELFTTSLSKEAATYLYNEGAQAYPGEDYEKVAIHTMLAHSFLGEGNLDSARVEAARINTKLNEINGFYKDNKNKYRDDAYARYLSAMIYEANGELDSAIVDYRNALKIYEGDYQETFGVSPPNELVAALYRLFMQRDRKDEAKALAKKYNKTELSSPSEYASIIVVHEVGVINEKRAEDFVVPWGGSVLRFSFPVIPKKSPSRDATGFRVNEGTFEKGELAQNFNTIAYANLEDRRVRMIVKSAARIIIKNQLTQKAEKELGAAGLIAATVYGAVTETADTRQWTTLPAAVYVTRKIVKPGEYSIEITNNGRVRTIKKIRLKKGDVQIIRDA